MQSRPEEVFSSAQIRALEQTACAQLGIELYALMERAGESAWVALQKLFPQARSIAVLAGAGNNGGDGWVLARLAHTQGYAVRVHALLEIDVLTGDAARAARAFLDAGGEQTLEPPGRADVYVDALLGIGARGDLSGRLLKLAGSMIPARTLALDVPSGLCADSGWAGEGTPRARATLCFVGLKLGLLTGAGPGLVGELLVDDLGLASFYAGSATLAKRITEQAFSAALKPRSRVANKGNFGHVLAIGGDHGMGGAISLCGQSAQRAGAGLVTIATRAEHVSALLAACPEIQTLALADDTQLKLAKRVVVIGPGLGQGAWGRQLLAQCLNAGAPLVMDADALNLLAAQAMELPHDTVLTPHPGEAARLLGSSVAAIERDRPKAAREIAQRYGCVAVLKGAGTLVASATGELNVCDRGNPGMASGGSGDVLAGVIAAFLAQGLKPFDAARFGVFAHASAGDLAARSGERGMNARDLLENLREAVNPVAFAND